MPIVHEANYFDSVKCFLTEDYFKGNQFSSDVIKAKYALSEKEKGQIAYMFKRVTDSIASMEPTKELQEYWSNRWFYEIWNDWWKPAGSIMQGAGNTRKISLSNCFSRDTEFITDRGVKSFNDFKEGDSVNVLTCEGGFKEAIVHKHGKQKLLKLIVGRNGYKKEIKCTPEHVWRVIEKKSSIVEKETRDLKVGDRIPYIKRKWSAGVSGDRYYCPIGFIHGLVFGDGSYYKSEDYCNIDLCGDSVQFSKLFSGFSWKKIEHPDRIRIYYLPNYMKKFPDFSSINSEYILGFLSGWFAADGTVNDEGHAEISSASLNNLREFKRIAESVGIYTNEVALHRDFSPFDGNPDQKLYRLYFIRDTLFPSFFVKKSHRKNFETYLQNSKSDSKRKCQWQVLSIENMSDTFLEDVWCVEESVTGTFVLAGGVSTHNCTTVAIDDDSLEAISKTGYKMKKAAAYRQGLGVDISPLRPRNSKVNNSAEVSSGAVDWMIWLNNIGPHIGQKGRIPAFLFSIGIQHPDVLDFIYVKSNLHAVQNANISIQITDDFMEAYEKDGDWKLFFDVKDTGEHIERTIKARELMHKIAEEACRYGEPGVQFMDTCRRESVTDVLGFPIKSSNACSEKIMYPDSTCVLSSINVGKFSSDSKRYKVQLDTIGESITRFLDDVVECEIRMEKSPFPEQRYVMQQLREIGCGITNLHGWLFDQELAYDSDKGIKKAEEFIKYYSYVCWKTSIALGKEKSDCQAFKSDKVKKAEFVKRMMGEFPDLEFKTLRNSQVMSFAPAGTLSLSFSSPTISTGIEPCPGFYYWKRSRVSGNWKWYFVVPNFVREYLYKKEVKLPFEGESIEDSDGRIGEKCIKLIENHFPLQLFRAAHQIDPMKKVELMSRFAKWVDSSMSVTYNIPENSTPELVESIYLNGWKKGVKSIAVYRDKSRMGVIEFEPPPIVEKRFEKVDGNGRPEDIVVHKAPKRLQLLPCNIFHVKVQAKKFIVIVGLLNDKPYEVFAGEQKEIEIPGNIKYGMIERAGSRRYNLYCSEKPVKEWKDDLELDGVLKIRNIIKQFDNEAYADTTRLVSTCLRHGVPISTIIDQLDKTESVITSFGKALMRVLKTYMTESVPAGICLECGGPTVRESGCVRCLDCNLSKC